ncbi:unnamed protein product [Cladocopium goreaui]|uniref:Uncharacterized protein n=1 Tax=Cladocopium goreaui TaxID=2562237 RepID=A0A9P1BVU8_9DINO|nr:unnamed protein product [Cladocopium goreaui]
MEDIEAGQVQIHPSRQPIYKKKLSNAMNNVQRMLLLKGGQAAKLQEEVESSFIALHATQKGLFSTQKELSDAKAVIAEQRGEISNLKRAIQTLENQILSDADMTSD